MPLGPSYSFPKTRRRTMVRRTQEDKRSHTSRPAVACHHTVWTGTTGYKPAAAVTDNCSLLTPGRATAGGEFPSNRRTRARCLRYTSRRYSADALLSIPARRRAPSHDRDRAVSDVCSCRGHARGRASFPLGWTMAAWRSRRFGRRARPDRSRRMGMASGFSVAAR